MKNIEANGIELSMGSDLLLEDLEKSHSVLKRDKRRVAIFGGSNIKIDSFYYEQARIFAKNISSSGISIITGGGPGIMEAGNLGVYDSGNLDLSYGIRVKSILNECVNDVDYIKDKNLYVFNTLSLRLLTLIGSSDVIVLFPGGFGTFEELFSLLVRIRVDMMKKVPVYLFGSNFWGGLVAWLNDVVLHEKTIDESDIQSFKIVDDIEQLSLDIINYCRSI